MTSPSTTTPSDEVTVEVLFAEARDAGRARRRRRAIIAAAVITALVATGGAFVFLRPGQDAKPGTATPETALIPASKSFPSTYIGYDVDDTTLKGGISLFDSTTGKVVRTIVPYTSTNAFVSRFSSLSQGFAVSDDAKHVFFVNTQTIDPGSGTEIANVRTQIAEATVATGHVRILADGTAPEVSSDGRLLAYRPGDPRSTDGSFAVEPKLGIIDLATGDRKIFGLPGVKREQAIQYSWLPGSTKLLVASTDVAQVSPASAMFGREPVTTVPGLTSRTQVFDASTAKFTALPRATAAALEQNAASDITLLGPSRSSGIVQIDELKGLPGSGAAEWIGTLNIHTGIVTLDHELPGGASLARLAGLPGASTGQRFLLENYENDPRVFRWTPSLGQRPTPIDATLNPTSVSPTS